MNIITLEEYKSYNSLSSNTKEDVKYSFLIDSVSSLIQTYLRYNFEGDTEYTETYSIDYDTDTIYLNHYPVNEDITVSELRRTTYDSSIHVPLTGPTDFILNATEGVITRIYTPGGFAKWPIGPSSVIVTYTTASAWSGGPIPSDLKLAAIELVNYYKEEQFRQSKSVQGTSIVNTLAQGEDFPKHIQVILDRYSLKRL